MKRSTKSTDKKQAEKLARVFEEESRAKRTATQARRILSDIFRDVSGEEMPSKTAREYLMELVDRKKREISAATLATSNSHALRFIKWLGIKADREIANITKQDITGYRNYVAGIAGPRTTNNTLRTLRTFFAAALKDGYIADDPAAAVDRVRDRTEAVRRPFILDALRALIAVANSEWQSMIRFGFHTGQRLSDIATLTWQNIDTTRGWPAPKT